MSTALQTTNTAIEQVNPELLTSYLDSFGVATKCSAQEKNQFLQIALAFNLNPFKREIYAIKYGQNSQFQIVVGYETYLKRAERSGKLDGCDTRFYAEDNDTICEVVIYRKDWSRPLTHRVYMSEYRESSNPLWKSKPKTMLRKVAVSQAYRMAFPDELGGMPYTQEELNVQDTTHEVIESRPTAVSPPANLAEELTAWQGKVDALTTPEQFQQHLGKLKEAPLKSLGKTDMNQMFTALCKAAEEKGVGWNKDSKTFGHEVVEIDVVEN